MLPSPLRQRQSKRRSALARASIEALEQRTLLAVGTNHWPIGIETLVNAYTTGNQTRPSVAMDATGNFVVSWESQTQFGFWNVWAQRFNSAGVKQGSEFFVSSDQLSEQRAASLAMNGSGNFVLAWHIPHEDAFSHIVSGLEIYARRFNAAGVAQGSDIHVNTYVTGMQQYPTVGMHADGSFVVVWSGDGPNGVNQYAQQFTAAGAPQGGQFVASGTEIPAEIDSDGNYVTAGNAADNIYARRYNAASAPISPQFNVNTNPVSYFSGADKGVAGNGNFAIAWSGIAVGDDSGGIHSQLYSAFGAATAATVGDRVWNDANGNGVQDAGEAGLAGVTVQIYNNAGVLAGTTTTNATGNYSFSVPSGTTAYLRFTAPAGYVPTQNDKGGNDSLDSDADPATGLTVMFNTGAAGTVNSSLDAGFSQPAIVNGIVYYDRNGDGIRNGSEEGLQGFQVFADFDGDGVIDSGEPTASSGADGSYTLNSLVGTYTIAAGNQDRWIEPTPTPATVSAGAPFVRDLAVRTTVHDTVSTVQGSEFRANTLTASKQFDVSIAMDANGDYVATWISYATGANYADIAAQRFDASGIAQGSEFRVNTYTTGYQYWPSAAMDADGDFVITWSSLYQDGSSYGVYAQRYNAAGAPQGGEFRVNDFTFAGQGESVVALEPDGDFVISWSSYYQDGAGNTFGVYGKRYNAGGVAQGGEFRVNTYTTSQQRLPSIDIDADGDFVIAYHSKNQDASGYSVYARRYNSSGVAQGTEFRVNTFTPGDQGKASVAMDSTGNFVVAWQSYAQDGSNSGIFARRYNATGVAQGDEFRVNAYTTNRQEDPSVAMSPSGDFVIGWDSLEQDGSAFGVYARSYNAAGVPQAQPFRVNTYTTNSQEFASVAMDASGDFAVAWQSSGQDGSGYGVYVQRYSVAARPAVTSSQFQFNTASQRLEFTFDKDVSASVSVSDLLLENLTTATTIPAAKIALSYNSATNTATFTFPGFTSGALPDGTYRATLLAAGVTDGQGNSLAYSPLVNFFFLAGDADHDRDVDVNDLGILATNWQQSPRTFAQGDFDYSGTVDVNDLGILASHWQQQLALPSAPFNAGARKTAFSKRLTDELAW
jgi:hypothetical protein